MKSINLKIYAEDGSNSDIKVVIEAAGAINGKFSYKLKQLFNNPLHQVDEGLLIEFLLRTFGTEKDRARFLQILYRREGLNITID